LNAVYSQRRTNVKRSAFRERITETGHRVDDACIVKVSRFLSKYLRHQPQRLGLTLEPGGWVAVEDLLAACASPRARVMA
jgi:RNA:NAD 2'-phosphotransferase (TPT1/KptA family)